MLVTYNSGVKPDINNFYYFLKVKVTVDFNIDYYYTYVVPVLLNMLL